MLKIDHRDFCDGHSNFLNHSSTVHAQITDSQDRAQAIDRMTDYRLLLFDMISERAALLRPMQNSTRNITLEKTVKKPACQRYASTRRGPVTTEKFLQ